MDSNHKWEVRDASYCYARKDQTFDLRSFDKIRLMANKAELLILSLPSLRSPSVIQESENLEKENAALRKEVKQLTEEAKYLSSVLSSHEPLCTGLSAQTPELLFPPHHSSYHNQHIPVPHYQH